MSPSKPKNNTAGHTIYYACIMMCGLLSIRHASELARDIAVGLDLAFQHGYRLTGNLQEIYVSVFYGHVHNYMTAAVQEIALKSPEGKVVLIGL